jgi:type II restriction enzyme
MKNYIPSSGKSKAVQQIINEALDVLECMGIPFRGKSERGLERMAMSFLAVACVTQDWKEAKSADDGIRLKTREIIQRINQHFEEAISPGSYDDIRRKGLKLLVLADLVVNSGASQGAATNDPTRGYGLHPDVKHVIIAYKTDDWEKRLSDFHGKHQLLSEMLARKRSLNKIPVTLPGGKPIELSLGEHNVLQKAIIEEFLPRFGSDCEVLYIGDTSRKRLHLEESELRKLNFFELSHDELPDIIAYSKQRNWLYLIEAVHSSGAMSEARVLELKRMLKDCTAELIFVTGFLIRSAFKRWMLDIAWETEVWIAENPDHLVHFNGHKFLGAY